MRLTYALDSQLVNLLTECGRALEAQISGNSSGNLVDTQAELEAAEEVAVI